MAILERLDGAVSAVLRRRHLVGRATGDTRIAEPAVSGEHAVFLWTGQGWELRDLGSRNGTWVGGERLGPGGRCRVKAGDRIAFGDPRVLWRLKTDGAPTAAAWGSSGPVEGEGRFLALPHADAPVVLIEVGEGDRWTMVENGISRPVESGEVLDVDGEHYRLELPVDLGPEVPLTANMHQVDLNRSVDAVRLDFGVSAD